MGNGTIIVRHWTFRLSETEIDDCLSAEEWARAATISDARRRQAYRRSRSLLRRALGGYLGLAPEAVDIEISSTGKPGVAHRAGIGFSLSHSGDWLAIAMADCAVGVDIETQRPHLDPLKLARRFFSSADAAALEGASSADRPEMFRRQWVAKEATAKADGTGLANTLERMECQSREGGIQAVHWGLRKFAVRNFQLADGTPGAVAIEDAAEIQLIHQARKSV